MSTLAIRDFKSVAGHGHLVAFLTIETPSGLLIHDCRLFEKDGNRWIGLPSRQYTKSDGVTAYAQVVDFATKQAGVRFQEEAMQAVDAYVASLTEDAHGASR